MIWGLVGREGWLGWGAGGWAGAGPWAGLASWLWAGWAAGGRAGLGRAGGWRGGLSWANRGWVDLLNPETEIGLLENMERLCPDRKNRFPDGQQQQAISICLFLS